jgi:hypothetical protein
MAQSKRDAQAKATAKPARQKKPREPKTFRDVIDRAQEDAAYSAQLKKLAAKAKSGNPEALQEFAKAFKLTPRALKELSPRAGSPAVLASTIPCTIVVTTTFLSCFPRTSYGYHWFCKEAH